MSIGGIGSANYYIYNNVHRSNNQNNGTDRFDRFGITTASNTREASEQSSRFSSYDAYKSTTVNINFKSEIGERYLQSLERRNANFSYQAKGGLQKVDNERYLIDVMDTIEGCWYIYDKVRDERIIFNPMNTTIQTDENTGKDYIVSCDPWGGLMNVMEADHALVESIKTFLQTDDVTKLNLNEKYTIEVHAPTGIEYLKVKGQEGNGTWFLTSEQEMVDKLQDLANLYKEKYPNLVKDDELALKFYAMGEVAGNVVRTENGIMVIACNGMSYYDNADPSKNWGVMWSFNDTDIYNKVMQALTEGIKAGSDVEDYEIWKAFFEEEGIEYEKALSDEELAEKLSFAKIVSYEGIMKDWKDQVKDNHAKNAALPAEVSGAEQVPSTAGGTEKVTDMAAGHFVFRYQAYLKHEEFWDMYLDGKVDLTTLVEDNDMFSEDELYDKFLRDMTNRKGNENR